MSKKFSNDWAKNRTVNQVMNEFSKSNLYCAMKHELGFEEAEKDIALFEAKAKKKAKSA